MAVTVIDVAAALPDITVLRDRCRALATLDAILSPAWEDRYYSFDAHWAPGQELASMRNGSGDEWSIVFSSAGAYVRGLDHESPMSPAANGGRAWPGVLDAVPEVFAELVAEPAFSWGATVCLWRQAGDERWHHGRIEFPEDEEPDGADWLFDMLVEGTPEGYVEFAEDYYEEQVDVAAVREVFAGRPLTAELIRRLNPDLTAADLAEDLRGIGYPL
ncbi:hypothetical protein [Actinoplanes sp. GCM10030250]|uniref:hypothetical protein n=1 Tax=Actinoplanes sp. GCM10030250 TaxID=3273376 RepID=UPI003608BA55